MLRLFRIEHEGAPRYVAERDGRWRLVDGDIFGKFSEGANSGFDAWIIRVEEQMNSILSRALASASCWFSTSYKSTACRFF